VLLENCLSVVNRLPAVNTLPNDKDEAAFKNMWNFNLPDAASGLLLLDINQGRIATETRSHGNEGGPKNDCESSKTTDSWDVDSVALLLTYPR